MVERAMRGGKISLSFGKSWKDLPKKRKKKTHNNDSVTVKAGNFKYRLSWTNTYTHM